jgi:transcriptional pleiotropic regulator of transition state genes
VNKVGNFNMSRPIDGLGRVVIPKEMRTVLGWNETDQIFIGIKDGTVFMRKFSGICPVCRNPFDDEKGLNVCDDCVSKLVNCSRI